MLNNTITVVPVSNAFLTTPPQPVSVVFTRINEGTGLSTYKSDASASIDGQATGMVLTASRTLPVASDTSFGRAKARLKLVARANEITTTVDADGAPVGKTVDVIVDVSISFPAVTAAGSDVTMGNALALMSAALMNTDLGKAVVDGQY